MEKVHLVSNGNTPICHIMYTLMRNIITASLLKEILFSHLERYDFISNHVLFNEKRYTALVALRIRFDKDNNTTLSLNKYA